LTHFEYVSVAVALTYSMVVGRLLTGLSPAFDARRLYWVQLCWIFQILSIVIFGWWTFWVTREVDWTPFRFVAALALPILQYVRASTIVSDDPASVESFREHFYHRRVRFFSISLATSFVTMSYPWVFGRTPWLTFDSSYLLFVPYVLVNVIGLLTASHRVHAALVVISIVMSVVGLAFGPANTYVP
jgi:hypothetical protein